MHIATFLTIGIPGVALLGTLGAYIRSSGHREGKTNAVIAENARAIDKLSGTLDKLSTTLGDHEHRITIVETKIDGL